LIINQEFLALPFTGEAEATAAVVGGMPGGSVVEGLGEDGRTIECLM
jgi:hypothetical protein